MQPSRQRHLSSNMQSIYLRGTSKDDSLMSLVTANLPVWEWAWAASVFISLRKINISDPRWEAKLFSRLNFRPLREKRLFKGSAGSMHHIFTSRLLKLRLVTEVGLLLNAFILQHFVWTLMSIAALDGNMQETNTQ